MRPNVALASPAAWGGVAHSCGRAAPASAGRGADSPGGSRSRRLCGFRDASAAVQQRQLPGRKRHLLPTHQSQPDPPDPARLPGLSELREARPRATAAHPGVAPAHPPGARLHRPVAHSDSAALHRRQGISHEGLRQLVQRPGRELSQRGVADRRDDVSAGGKQRASLRRRNAQARRGEGSVPPRSAAAAAGISSRASARSSASRGRMRCRSPGA